MRSESRLTRSRFPDASFRPMSTAVRQSPQRSDENLVVTAIAAFLVAALILGTVAYRYFKHSQQQQQTRSERQAYKRYNDYLDSTEQATAKPAANPPSPYRPARLPQRPAWPRSCSATRPSRQARLQRSGRTADRRGHHRCDGSRPGNRQTVSQGRLCTAARQLSASPDRRRQAAAARS
jgi:type II secretory pathway pseudopilin PulG